MYLIYIPCISYNYISSTFKPISIIRTYILFYRQNADLIILYTRHFEIKEIRDNRNVKLINIINLLESQLQSKYMGQSWS